MLDLSTIITQLCFNASNITVSVNIPGNRNREEKLNTKKKSEKKKPSTSSQNRLPHPPPHSLPYSLALSEALLRPGRIRFEYPH
jgi:hypothetical protein